MKVEKVSDLSKEDSWIVEKSDVTIKHSAATTDNGDTVDACNLHTLDSSDDDDDEADSDDEEKPSDVIQPAVKKIKLMGT